MRRRLLLMLSFLLIGSPLYAQDDSNVVEQATFQDFTYRVSADPIDDSKTFMLVSVTDEAQSLGDVMTGGAAFGVACYEGQQEPRVAVFASDYLSEGDVTVYYRFDDREPVGPVDWQVVSSSFARSTLATLDQSEINTLIDEAKTAAEMIFRIESNIDETERSTYSFSMYGITDGLTRMPCVR